MSTAEDGGATAKNAGRNLSYAGAGAGGKFRKKPNRRQTTPYDRPPATPRVDINNANSTWLTKLVLEPASRIISYGAHRLFGTVFTPRLPPPEPPQPLELNHNLNGGLQRPVADNLYSAQEFVGGEHGNLLNDAGSGISELEQLLKRNTFSRYEIDYLKTLLQSRVLEASAGAKGKESDGTALLSGRHGNYESAVLDNRNEGIRSRGVMHTPNSNFKVHGDRISSPAELAKAYMGGRSSKVSPSMLGIDSQVGRKGTELLNNLPFASNSATVWSRPEICTNLGIRVDKFTTPRSGGRSAIYNMARTPYSRFHSTSTTKGTGINNNASTQLSVPSSPFSPIQHGTLKRRRSILDDDVGTVGRVQRQKTDLLTSTTKVGIGSTKKLPLIGKQPSELSKRVAQSGNVNGISTRQFFVPKRSSEVAARILQHLENVSPKGKPAESQLFSVPEKSPFGATPDVIRERTIRNMWDVDSSRHTYLQDDHKMKDTPNVSLFYSRDSSQKQKGSEETGPKEAVAALITHSPVKNNAISLEASGSKPVSVDLDARNGVSRPPEDKVLTMIEQKESLECEGSIYSNGTATDMHPEGIDEATKMVKTTRESEIKSIPSLVFDKTSEISGTMNCAFPDTKNTSTATQSADVYLPPQTENTDNPRILTFSSESISKMCESKLESPYSLVYVSPPTGGQLITQSENEGQVEGACSTSLSSTSNGPVPSKEVSASLFTMASPNHTNHISNGSSSSTSVLNFSAASSSTLSIQSVVQSPFGNISCVEDKSSSSPVFKFGQVSSIIESPVVQASLEGNANAISRFSMGQTRGIDKPKRRIITFKKSTAKKR